MSDPTHDPEFEEFLKRRQPLFRREPVRDLEPPPEVDRLVLDRARDAIREAAPLEVYRGPRWAAPMAIAATLVLGLAFVFHARTPDKTPQPVPEVRVENIANRYEVPAPADPAPPMDSTPAPVAAPPPPAPTSAPAPGDPVMVDLVPPMGAATTDSSAAPAWRRDAATWRAEIERLRAAGETARADAEAAEFNRQHRAYAGSPDR